MRRVTSSLAVTSGVAMVEVLVALVVFALALAGGLRAQLGALAGTRDTLAQARAVRLLQDLVSRSGVGELASLAPASLDLAAVRGAGLPASLAEWTALAAPSHAGPPAARLCVSRDDPVLELTLAWQLADGQPVETCARAAGRALAFAVIP